MQCCWQHGDSIVGVQWCLTSCANVMRGELVGSDVVDSGGNSVWLDVVMVGMGVGMCAMGAH